MRARVLRCCPHGDSVFEPGNRRFRFAVGVTIEGGRFVAGDGRVDGMFGNTRRLLTGVVVTCKDKKIVVSNYFNMKC